MVGRGRGREGWGGAAAATASGQAGAMGGRVACKGDSRSMPDPDRLFSELGIFCRKELQASLLRFNPGNSFPCLRLSSGNRSARVRVGFVRVRGQVSGA